MRDSRSRYLPIIVVASLAAAAASCVGLEADDGGADTGEANAVALTSEGFEAGTKSAYAAGNVSLDSGTWNMNDALIGTSASDVKTGTRSGRLRNSGRITMSFDRSAGAGTVTVRHASFGTDASGVWALFLSRNGGASWTQVGSSRTTSTGPFATATFNVNVGGAVRLEIRKLDGGGNRINVDDVTITDFGSGGGGASISEHTVLGLPSPASTSDPNSFLSVKAGYVLSYNSARKVPNWVSWELNTSYLGSVDRRDDFRPDSTLPAGLPQASLADYSGSGFDRGHVCPSADRTLTAGANSETFFLSNMVPQAPNNNRGPWADLENESREISRTGRELFVIAGGVFSRSSSTIGSGVSVPDETYKVIVVLDQVGDGPEDVTSDTRVIGVLMPNSNSEISQSDDWQNFRVSVDEIEAVTGHDFLSDVDPDVQDVIEATVDDQ